MSFRYVAALSALMIGVSGAALAETLTIATVNNGDMIRMQGLTDDFTGQEPRHRRSSGSRWRRTSCASR